MARIAHRDFSRGLWYAGPRDTIPRTALRQAKGVRSFSSSGAAIRSRWGNQLVTATPATVNAFFRFANVRYGQIGNNFGTLEGAFSSVLGVRSLAAGCILRVAAGIPTTEADVTKFPNGPEHLFVAGSFNRDDGPTTDGNTLPFKISTSKVFSLWGIRSPFTDWIVSPDPPIILPVLDEFEFQDLFTDGSGNITLSANTQNKQVGAASVQATVIADVHASCTIKKTANFLNYIGPGNTAAVSPGQDCVRLWVYCDRPENLDALDIIIDVGNQNIAAGGDGLSAALDDTFSFRVLVGDGVSDPTDVSNTTDDPRLEQARKDEGRIFTDESGGPQFGLNDHERNALDKEASIGTSLGISKAASAQIVLDTATTRLSPVGGTWTLLSIPKQAFTANGKATHGVLTDSQQRGWANIRRTRLSITTNENGGVNVLFDQMGLHLGTGIQGDYKYALTYKNSKTGTRSNPSVIKSVKNIRRQVVILSGPALLPGNMSPDADRVEVWRTLGGGEVLFKADEFDPATPGATGIYADFVADYDGIQDVVRIGIAERTTKYLQDLQIQFDNKQPAATTRDVAGPYLGRLFTLDGAYGQRGKLFYSPPGRLESVSGFIIITGDDDPLQRVIAWNGIYVWSEEKVFALEGTDPFIAREIFGVPGTIDPKSVTPSPEGVFYKAGDGIRLFNGASSSLVFPDAISPVLRGESVTLVTAAFGRVIAAAYHHEEYLFGDGTTTYAVNVRTGAWRNCGYAARTLYDEKDTGQLLLGVGSNFFLAEVPGITSDNGTAIPFLIELPGTVLEDQSGVNKLIQRIYLDIATGGQNVTATLLLTAGGSEITLGTINTNAREMVEIPIASYSDVAGVRVAGSLTTNPVEVAGIEYDWHQPEIGGEST